MAGDGVWSEPRSRGIDGSGDRGDPDVDSVGLAGGVEVGASVREMSKPLVDGADEAPLRLRLQPSIRPRHEEVGCREEAAATLTPLAEALQLVSRRGDDAQAGSLASLGRLRTGRRLVERLPAEECEALAPVRDRLVHYCTWVMQLPAPHAEEVPPIAERAGDSEGPRLPVWLDLAVVLGTVLAGT